MPNSKLKQYLQIKSDPALALMRMIKDHEKEMEEYMAACDKKMEKMMEEKMESMIAKMEQKEPMHADFIQKIVNQAVSQVIGNAKGEKGDSIIGPMGPRGDKGDSIKGEKGNDGYTPIKDKNYFDGKDGKNGSIIKKVFVNEKGELIMQIDD